MSSLVITNPLPALTHPLGHTWCTVGHIINRTSCAKVQEFLWGYWWIGNNQEATLFAFWLSLSLCLSLSIYIYVYIQYTYLTSARFDYYASIQSHSPVFYYALFFLSPIVWKSLSYLSRWILRCWHLCHVIMWHHLIMTERGQGI